MIPRDTVREFVKGRQQNYAAARVLLPDALDALASEREQIKENVDGVLSSILPHLPGQVSYEVYLDDICSIAETVQVDDGGQIIFVNRHFLGFLRNFIELVARGIRLGEGGQGIVDYGMSAEEKRLFGLGVGEYLNFGAPVSFPPRQSDDLGPEMYIAAVEFVLAHEIVHRIEEDSADHDLSLDGFQDFCRIRGREYRCDRRAVALVLERRKNLDMPEMAFLGAICALMAISWLEQFTPGHVPTSWHHPGSDSRVLRVLLEEPLFWKAAGLDGQPNGLSAAALRRAFRFMTALEDDPKLIASPLNHLIGRCIQRDVPDHDLFEARVGEIFARCRVDHFARSLGAMWGSSRLMAEEERAQSLDDCYGRLACTLFDHLHAKLVTAGGAAKSLAYDIGNASEHRAAASGAP